MHYSVDIIKAQIEKIVNPALRQELTELVQSLLKEKKANTPSKHILLIQKLSEQLNLFQEAWPIIEALKKEGGEELITILDKANECSLIALASITESGDFALLINSFLIKNSKDLSLVNRSRLTLFLRQPDFSSWLTDTLESLINQSIDIMSTQFLLTALAPCANELKRLTELRMCISSYSFPLHLEAMWAMCHFYQAELQNDNLSPRSKSFVLLLHDLLNTMDLARQMEFIQGLSPEYLLLIIDHCLLRCTQGVVEEQNNCFNILFLLCSEPAMPNKGYMDQVKARLRKPDIYLFDNSKQHELAKNVIAKSPPVTNSTCEWIQQIVTSPQFVAQSSTKVLKHLSDRYRLYTLTLNPVEYSELISFSHEYNSYMDEFQKHMLRINQQLIKHPEAKAYWLTKQSRLLKFGMERLVNALFFQLENSCDHYKNTDPTTAYKALDTLYSYYTEVFTHLRFDLMWRAIDLAYHLAEVPHLVNTNLCDVVLAQDNVVPAQSGIYDDSIPILERRKEVYLYNSEGQKIGFIIESNQAIVFVDDEPVCFNQTSPIHINESVYDSNGIMLGNLTESGQIRNIALVHHNASARILSKASEKKLEKSPRGLALLIQNILFENSVEALYSGDTFPSGSSKYPWLEQRFSRAIQNVAEEIDPCTLNTLMHQFSDDTLFNLLETTKSKSIAFQLFHGILNQDNKREILFKGAYESEFQRFLERHGVIVCFADYLLNYHDKPWFAEFLLRFAFYSKHHKIDNLLSDALSLVTTKASQEEKLQEPCDALLNSLIGTEACTAVLLKEFFNDDDDTPVQEISRPEINKIVAYFNKTHLIAAIEKLNKTSHWQATTQYKLILHIMDRQNLSLFPANNPNLISKQEWQNNELNEMARFINRHLGKKRLWDKNHALGHGVLGELIFRCAKIGQPSLFYSNKKLNAAIVRLSFTRRFLERLVDKFWVPEAIKEQVVDEVERIKGWVNDQSNLQKELKEDQVLLDWRLLVIQTWQEINKKKLPVLCAYLLNYSGKRKPLLPLLQNYFNAFENHPDYLHPITKLLHQFPERDISAVIFESLEETLIKNPTLLDSTILRYMAQYYAKKRAIVPLKSLEAELNLLTYFGQNQDYTLVEKGCEELAKSCNDKEVKKRLIKAATEARVERNLKSHSKNFFFFIIKLIKRFRHYGFNTEENASKIVRFCDDNNFKVIRQKAPNDIKIPASSVQMGRANAGFHEKRKNLINLLDTIKRSSINKVLVVQTSNTKQTLFASNPETSSPIAEKQQLSI